MKKRDFLKASLLAVGSFIIPRKVRALEYYPSSNDLDWAIVYGTWCGTSRDTSLWISEGMDGIAQVFDVRENPDLSKYKHIIVGGSIRSGVTSKELQEFLAKNKASFQGKIKGLFAVCGNMKQPVTDIQYKKFFNDHLMPLTGTENVPVKVFLGRITWGLMEPEVRKQMQSFPNMDEYDNLKRSECMEFGREVLMQLNNTGK